MNLISYSHPIRHVWPDPCKFQEGVGRNRNNSERSVNSVNASDKGECEHGKQTIRAKGYDRYGSG
jgi:hypothetical protein